VCVFYYLPVQGSGPVPRGGGGSARQRAPLARMHDQCTLQAPSAAHHALPLSGQPSVVHVSLCRCVSRALCENLRAPNRTPHPSRCALPAAKTKKKGREKKKGAFKRAPWTGVANDAEGAARSVKAAGACLPLRFIKGRWQCQAVASAKRHEDSSPRPAPAPGAGRALPLPPHRHVPCQPAGGGERVPARPCAWNAAPAWGTRAVWRHFIF
jgi:hypothetical protein